MNESTKPAVSTKYPETFDGQVNYITLERKQVIQRLALASQKLGDVPSPDEEPAKSLLPRLDALLTWLDSTVKMTPELKTKSQLDAGLILIFRNPRYHFSQSHQQKARELYERWESEHWGAPVSAVSASSTGIRGRESSTDDEGPSEPPGKRRKSMSGAPISESDFKPVPPDHRIWGVNGIMHGMARKGGKRKTTALNPDYKHRRKDANHHGDNGIAVGSWFPYQLAALFHGVHGSSQAGIYHGEGQAGAYSIVVSGLYDELDNDRGERIWYSGSGSHENEDPSRPATRTRGTSALHKSIETGTPVRVLRSASGKSRYAPSRGIRYDGLYTVVRCQQRRNAKGGLYEQFELQRLPDQLSLEECRKRPNSKEIRDFDLIERGY